MNAFPLQVLLSAALLLATPAAMAQAIYKVVGPDGKVTFSDRPADGDARKVDVLVPPAPREEATGAASTVSPAARAAEAYRAKRAAAAVTPPATPAPAAMSPELAQAIVGAMGLEDLVAQSERLCIQTLPTSFKRYNAAASDWGRRNLPALARTRSLVQTMTSDQRVGLTALVKQQTASALAVVEKASMHARIKWCDQSVGEINEGKLDVANKPAVWGALMRGQVNKP
ncbi:MAG: hypothetical protein ACLGHE_05915 [Gammaproteobacteria bacterium]